MTNFHPTNTGLLSLLLATPVVITVVAFAFKYFQNQKELVGGNISTPKSLWLSYTVISWFLVPLSFLFFDLNSWLMGVVIVHLISFWVRGLIELVMIYKFFNWSPRYGIAHSGLHTIIIFIGIILTLINQPSVMNSSEKVVIAFLISLFIGTSFETLFALLFLKVRGKGNYKEEHKIYFASNEPQWQRVNNLTKLALVFGLGAYAISAGLLLS